MRHVHQGRGENGICFVVCFLKQLPHRKQRQKLQRIPVHRSETQTCDQPRPFPVKFNRERPEYGAAEQQFFRQRSEQDRRDQHHNDHLGISLKHDLNKRLGRKMQIERDLDDMYRPGDKHQYDKHIAEAARGVADGKAFRSAETEKLYPFPPV